VRRNNIGRIVGALIVIGGIVGGATADADTVATFSDPTTGPETPLFTLSGDELSGDWAGMGPGGETLDLHVPWTGMMYPNASFMMMPVTVTGFDLGAGMISFYDEAGDPLFDVEFDSGFFFAPFGFGAADSEGDGVTISGPAIPDVLTDESFAFSFANQAAVDARSPVVDLTWTAAFTSSAIPEPASLIVLALGLLVHLRRR
jgi:hypothetical protein